MKCLIELHNAYDMPWQVSKLTYDYVRLAIILIEWFFFFFFWLIKWIDQFIRLEMKTYLLVSEHERYLFRSWIDAIDKHDMIFKCIWCSVSRLWKISVLIWLIWFDLIWFVVIWFDLIEFAEFEIVWLK